MPDTSKSSNKHIERIRHYGPEIILATWMLFSLGMLITIRYAVLHGMYDLAKSLTGPFHIVNSASAIFAILRMPFDTLEEVISSKCKFLH